MYNYLYDHLNFMFRYFLLNYYIEEFSMIIHFLQMLEDLQNFLANSIQAGIDTGVTDR